MNTYQMKRAQECMVGDLKDAFLSLATEQTYPGITGNVRSLDVRAERGYAEIVLSSAPDIADMEEEDFYVSLCTVHPQSENMPVGEAYEDDPRRVQWTHTHINRNLRSNEVPFLDEPVWFAIDVDQAINDEPVTAAEALALLSKHLMKEGK